ncbi:MAG: hypothetical protein LIO99_05260 [Clostridiales bacterium]|nr:hypothetical protein [Clostridiales bacterium]
MKEKCKVLKSVFLSDWSPMEKGLLLTDVLLFGVLLGCLTSPLKNGLSFFSNNSWDIDNSSDDHSASDDHSMSGLEFEDDEDWEDEDDEEDQEV